MRRGSSRGPFGRGYSALASSLTLGAFLVIGCSGAGSIAEPGRAGAAPRAEEPRPPGIAIDPVLELPRATEVAEPTAGFAVLSEPVDPEPARRVVRAFFEAVILESTTSLELLLDRGAHTRPNVKARAEAALPWWRRRFDRLDYTGLGGEVFYRRSDIEAHTARDAAALTLSRSLPTVPRGDDVVVRVPIMGQTAEKLFGPELVFLLKRSTSSSARGDSASAADQDKAAARTEYKIAELFEDFRLP